MRRAYKIVIDDKVYGDLWNQAEERGHGVDSLVEQLLKNEIHRYKSVAEIKRMKEAIDARLKCASQSKETLFRVCHELNIKTPVEEL